MSRFSLDRLRELRSGKCEDKSSVSGGGGGGSSVPVPISSSPAGHSGSSGLSQDAASLSSTSSQSVGVSSLPFADRSAGGSSLASSNQSAAESKSFMALEKEQLKSCDSDMIIRTLSQSYTGPDRPTSLLGQLSTSYSDKPSPERFHDFLPSQEPSPMKERILGAFAKLAPDTSELEARTADAVSRQTSGMNTSQGKSEGSWLLQVKGRFIRTSSTTTSETAAPPQTSAKEDILQVTTTVAAPKESDVLASTSESIVATSMSHSVSDVNIGVSSSSSAQDPCESGKKRPQSQIFDFEATDWSTENPGVWTEKSAISSTDTDTTTSTPTVETPSKVRKRFGISFLDRTGSASPRAPGTPSKSASSGNTPATDTPRRSLRSLMKSFNKTTHQETATTSPTLCSVADMMIEGGYPQGADGNLGPPSSTPSTSQQAVKPPPEDAKEKDLSVDEDAVEAQEEEYSWNSDYDINQYGIMKGEAKAVSPSTDPGGETTSVGSYKVHRLPVLVNPVLGLILAVINFTGLFPSWLSGFLTGLLLCALVCIFILLKLNPAVSYIPCSHENSKPAQIQVFEEPPLTQAWMNLLPQKFHPYDCETYQVKNTISVRVTVEHHMLKIEYPEKNISMRQSADEVIPSDLKFHLHTDHIDLSKASIRLLPDKLANSKKFKKKYPIEIKVNAFKSGLSLSLPANTCPEFGDDEELEEYESVDGSPLSSSPAHHLTGPPVGAGQDKLAAAAAPGLDNTSLDTQMSTRSSLTEGGHTTPRSSLSSDINNSDNKSFYLFARSDREKEDVYKALLDGHHFLEDSFRDADRMQGIAKSDNSRPTARERGQYFADFMSKVMEAPTAKYPPSPASTPLTSPLPSPPPLATTPGGGGGVGSPLDYQYPEWCAHFLNVYIYRMFYDVHKNKELTEMIMKRVNNKLAKVKELKYFKYIGISNLGFGVTTPQIKWVSRPSQNVRGLWTHVGVEYEGCITVSVEVSGLNLLEDAPGGGVQFKMLMEEDPGALPVLQAGQGGQAGARDWSRLEAATNSDEEDSDESDSEEQDCAGIDGEQGQATRKWWEIVQENDLVKSGLSRLSTTCWWKSKVENIDFTLRLEVRKIKGVLALNIPPPPSDRLWFAFKTSPELDIRMFPYFGDDLLGDDNSLKSTIINKVSQLVNTKIEEEVVKAMVLPNMIDLPVKIMDGLPFSNIPERNREDTRNKLVIPPDSNTGAGTRHVK